MRDFAGAEVFGLCSSIQLDFNLPSRFDVHYFDRVGQRKVPYMIHRAIYGPLERFIGILLENYGKALPFWMHPHQFKVLSVSPDVSEYCEGIIQGLRQRGFHVESDLGPKNISEKMKRSHDEMIYSLLIIGNKEKLEKSVLLKRGNEQKLISLSELLQRKDEAIFD